MGEQTSTEDPNHWEEIMPDVEQVQDDLDEAAEMMTLEQFAELTERVDGIQTRLEDNAFLLRFLTGLNVGGTAADKKAIQEIASRVAKAQKALEPTRRRQWSSPSVSTAHATLALAEAVLLLLKVAARHAPRGRNR